MHPAIWAGVSAFFAAIVIGPAAIRYLHRLKFGQQVRVDGPKTHLKKQGTPTMGGVIILASLAFATALFASKSEGLLYAVIAIAGYALIGAVDDLLKIVAKRSLGLRARQKLVAQVLIALLPSLWALATNGTSLPIPFTESALSLHPVLYVLFSVVLIVGFGNAANITDGLDGLLAGSTAISATVYALITAWAGYPELSVLSAAMVGACLGFTWFNAHPAQVIMGDTGSLALGAGLATLAVVTNTHFHLIIVGGLFVIEALSVMMQVAYFRYTKGRRLFRMAPIHHHFELIGWAEPKVTMRFWLVALVCGVVGLMAY